MNNVYGNQDADTVAGELSGLETDDGSEYGRYYTSKRPSRATSGRSTPKSVRFADQGKENPLFIPLFHTIANMDPIDDDDSVPKGQRAVLRFPLVKTFSKRFPTFLADRDTTFRYYLGQAAGEHVIEFGTVRTGEQWISVEESLLPDPSSLTAEDGAAADGDALNQNQAAGSVWPAGKPASGWASDTSNQRPEPELDQLNADAVTSFELLKDVIDDCEPFPGPNLVVSRAHVHVSMDEIAPDYRAACGAADVNEYLAAAERAGVVQTGGEREGAWIMWVDDEEKVTTPAPRVTQPEVRGVNQQAPGTPARAAFNTETRRRGGGRRGGEFRGRSLSPERTEQADVRHTPTHPPQSTQSILFSAIRSLCATLRPAPVQGSLPPRCRAVLRVTLAGSLQDPRFCGLKAECLEMGGFRCVLAAAVAAGEAIVGGAGESSWVAAHVSDVSALTPTPQRPCPAPTAQPNPRLPSRPTLRRHAALLTCISQLPSPAWVRPPPGAGWTAVLRKDVGSLAVSDPDLHDVVSAAGGFIPMVDRAVEDCVITVGGRGLGAWIAVRDIHYEEFKTPMPSLSPLLTVAAATFLEEAMYNLQDDKDQESYTADEVLDMMVKNAGNDVLANLGYDDISGFIEAARRARVLTVTGLGSAERVSLTVPPDQTPWRPLLEAIKACPPVPACTASAYDLPLYHVVLRSHLGILYKKAETSSFGHLPMADAVKAAEVVGMVVTGGKQGTDWVAAPATVLKCV